MGDATVATPRRMLAAALDYALGVVFGRAVSVFPLSPRGKLPAIEGGKGYQDATTDPEQIEEWWAQYPGANIGLPLNPNGLCAVDLDGLEGLASWSELDGRVYPGLLTCCTATSGGAHLIYELPRGRLGRGSVGVFPGVDLRGPGYIVAPPSVHPSGHVYRWEVTPAQLSPALAPEWILQPVEAERPPAVPVAEARSGTHSAYGHAALAGMVAQSATAPQGMRNHTLFSCACRVFDLAREGHVDPQNGLELIAAAAAVAGLPNREIERTLRSAQARVSGGGVYA